MNLLRIRTLVLFAVMCPMVFGEDSLRARVSAAVDKLDNEPDAVLSLISLTGRDFGLRPELWKKWLDRTSDKQLTQIAERLQRAEELDKQHHEFALAFAALSFSFRRDVDEMKKAEAEWDRVQKASTEPLAYQQFSAGVRSQAESGDRSASAKSLRAVFEQTPLSHYATEADELSLLLYNMADEDNARVEPREPEKLAGATRMEYLVYQLRNVQVEQFMQPGKCHVLSPSFFGNEEKKFNSAIELSKIGAESVPALIALLDDRRPIRSVGHWRDFWPERMVLRYQDAAIQILDELLPAVCFNESCNGEYLSTEKPEMRYRRITQIRAWFQASQGKSEPEKLWLAVKMHHGIYPVLKSLKLLATVHGQKADVLKELHDLYEKSHTVYRPIIVELMAELGDESKLDDIQALVDQKTLGKLFGRVCDDMPCASGRAEDHAKHLLEKYRKIEKKP